MKSGTRLAKYFSDLRKKNFKQIARDLLFNETESDELKAISVGFGVFIGIFPIWGFQMLTAIAVSVFFRLNKALVLIATNISAPPFWPFIMYSSLLAGEIWVGEDSIKISIEQLTDWGVIQNGALQYALGAVTLAISAGLFFGFCTYLLLKLFKRKPVSEPNSKLAE